MNKRNIAAFTRAPQTRNQVMPYAQKFSGLIKLCNSAKFDRIQNVMVACPWVIGDTYEELIESLSRIAEAELALIVGERCKTDLPGSTGVNLN